MSVNNLSISSIIQTIKDAKLLEQLLDAYDSLGIRPILGYEIEFYLPSANTTQCKMQIQDLFNTQVLEEKGKNQYEINQGPFPSVLSAIESIHLARAKLVYCGANLSPKPFINDYGNSMHLHLNFLDLANHNIFNDDQVLQRCAYSICDFLSQTLYVLMPSEENYLRFSAKFMAPTHISYGKNNRSAAVRVPGGLPKRLEYRICSNQSDPYVAIFILLKASRMGLLNAIDISNFYGPIFGNAFDEQYLLEPLAKNLTQAQKAFNMKFFIE